MGVKGLRKLIGFAVVAKKRLEGMRRKETILYLPTAADVAKKVLLVKGGIAIFRKASFSE